MDACLVTKVVTKGWHDGERITFLQSTFTLKNKVKKLGHASIVQSWRQAAAPFSMLSICM